MTHIRLSDAHLSLNIPHTLALAVEVSYPAPFSIILPLNLASCCLIMRPIAS